ncbi:MAG TPA: hypothetical protein VNO21_24960, partial [Polyangiaceae bacterium]|nr:hypothetical protein [Polyangiaceae bacterium]
RVMLPYLEDAHKRLPTLSMEDAALVWVQLVKIRQIWEVVDSALRDLARQAPIALANGKELSERRYPRGDFSQTLAIELMRELGATDEQIEACRVTSMRSDVRQRNAPNVGTGRRRGGRARRVA